MDHKKDTDTSQKTAKNTNSSISRTKAWHLGGTLLLCFVASFLGAWFFVVTGLVHLDASRTLSENRETLVLQEGEVVAEVFKRVSPSTVAVIGQSVTQSGWRGQQVRDLPGSGIVISSDGYVLTNKHVVPEGVDKAVVVLHDGTEYTDATVVGRDPFNDIAFLKINGVDNMEAAVIGDSDKAEPGQKVVAIGNALGEFRNSVTTGIISGIGRPIQAFDSTGASERLENLLQTDAAINPGNSGGPLLNLQGEVIGINTATSERGEAISFAIPINDAKGMIKSVLDKGEVVRAYLGIRYVGITPALAQQMDLPVNQGALLRSGNGEPAVVNGSAAQIAGLQENDIITHVNGQQIGQSSLGSKLSRFAPGDTVELTIMRDNNEQTISVELGEYPG